MYRKGELSNSDVGQLPFFWASATPRELRSGTEGNSCRVWNYEETVALVAAAQLPRGGTRLKKMGTAGGGGGEVGDCTLRIERRGGWGLHIGWRLGRILGGDGA